MSSFHEIAIPHKDIYEGKLTLETYAAKLWDVYNDEGPEDYRDSKIFFQRTFETKNLEKIIKSVKSRLDGGDVDHFRPIKTPFGGGKTHTLIYLYHKFTEWYGKKPVVIVGTELDPNTQTIWGEIEKQLTGKISKLSSKISHGATILKEVLIEHQPILILIDELLHYVVRANGVKIEESNLAEQTIAFIQELGDAVTSLKHVCVVITLPSSANEQLNDEIAVDLFEKLKKFSARIEDSVSPVDDKDIPNIIRARLFQTNDDQMKDRAESIIKEFVDYCDEEDIIPEGLEKSEYRKDFERSYPFLPQVIDVLYKRWGTLQSFQRTRGVLRLLSIVVNDLMKSDKQFISLGDFDLSNERLRGELTRHLDDQFQSVIAQDIVGRESGSSKVNKMMPQNLWGKELGTRAARAIFMYSHSGGIISRGATESEIMRATVYRGIESANISRVLEKFRNQLFYLNTQDGRYLFTKEANILKMKLDKMENISSRDLDETEKQLLKENINSNRFKVIIWPKSPRDVENSHSLKLVILKENDEKLIESIYDNVGETPRVYKNNIFILTPSDGEKIKFLNSLRSKIAWLQIKNGNIPLRDEQKKNLEQELKRENENLVDYIKEYYSTIYVSEKNSAIKNHISVPVSSLSIDQIVYDYLKQEYLINEQLGPLLIKTQYLKNNQYVDTNLLYETMLRTPGERRPVSKKVLENAIRDGVSKEDFGLGELENNSPLCKYFGNNVYPIVSFDPGEIIIQSQICKQKNTKEDKEEFRCDNCEYKTTEIEDLKKHTESHNIKTGEDEITSLNFSFIVPEGAINYTPGMFLHIAEKFKQFQLTISARDGKMTKHDVENIKEALRQMGASSDLTE